MSELKKLIEDYDMGLVTDSELVSKLAGWDYEEQDSNSSPWEADANYVEGSWDDVQNAMYDGIIPDNVYERINNALDERLFNED